MRKLTLVLIVAGMSALLASIGSAQAQANLSFSGGNNTPFALTLNLPVQYTINAAPSGNGPFFILKGVGDVLGNTGRGATGTMTFSINNGAPQSLTNEVSGTAVGSIVANDLFIYGQFTALTLGSTFTLSAGTLTTTTSVAAAPPSAGSFPTYITDSNGSQISTLGVAVPEPATWALFLFGGLGLVCYAQRFRGVA